MNMYPKVSVIISTFRRDEELRRAIQSIKDQTYSNIEVIVISDNANIEWNDKIFKIVHAFQYSINIKLIINQSNLGSARTRNVGIKKASGDYITFLDDDDMYLPNKIESQVFKMIEDKSDYSITNLFLYNLDNKIVDKRIRKNLEKINTNNELLKYHLKFHLTGTMSLMFKKEYLTKIGGFDEIDLGDEFYLVLKAILEKGNFAYYNECNAKAYIHDNNSGLSSGIKKIDGEKVLLDRKLQYRIILNKKDIRTIYSRHYLVLGYTYYKMGKYSKTLKYIFTSLFISPLSFIYFLRSR